MSTLANQVAVSVGSRVVYLATRLILPPVILAHLSLAEYGLWASAFILVAYVGMSAFGIGNVLIRYTAQWHVQGNLPAISRLLSTGLILSAGLSLLALLLLWLGLPTLLGWLAVSEALAAQAQLVFLGVVAAFLLDMSIGSLLHVLGALQHYREEALIWMCAFLLESVLIIAFLLAGWGLAGLVLAFALRNALSAALACWRLHQHLPQLQLRLRHFDRSLLPLFWRFGGVVQLSGMLGMMLGSIEKVLAGSLIGPAATALFELGQKFPVMLVSIPSAINAAAFPATTHALETEGMLAARRLYLANLRYVSMLCSVICAFLACFATPVLTAWLGARPEMPELVMLLSLFCLPYQLLAMTGPASAFFRAAGTPARELVFPLLQIALLLVLLPLLLGTQGKTVYAIAVAVAAAMCVSALLYLQYAHRQLGIAGKTTWQGCGITTLGPWLLAGLLASAWPESHYVGRSSALFDLLLAGAAYAAGLLLLARFSLQKEEKSWLSHGWLRLRGLA